MPSLPAIELNALGIEPAGIPVPKSPLKADVRTMNRLVGELLGNRLLTSLLLLQSREHSPKSEWTSSLVLLRTVLVNVLKYGDKMLHSKHPLSFEVVRISAKQTLPTVSTIRVELSVVKA